MLYNYFKIAWRNLLRNRMSSGINILGLTLGLICFILIVLFIFDQHQYDRHHELGSHLYRVETEIRSSEGSWLSSTVSPPIVPMLQRDFPEVSNSTRVVDPPETSHHILKWNNSKFFETTGFYVDSTFFQMFDYDWTEGSSVSALDEPYTVVLTKDVATKLFGDVKALGETIEIINRFGANLFRVTGVVNQKTHKSHIRPNFYMAMNSGGMGAYVQNNDQWAGGNFIHGYVQLHPNADPNDLISKIPGFLQKHGSEQFKEFASEKILTLQPVKDIHLLSTRQNQLAKTGNIQFLKILLLIAIFILVIACVNFMNLATSKSLKRGIEVGIRKTIGASRKSLAKQFYLESFLVTAISFLLALMVTSYLLPLASGFTGSNLGWRAIPVPILIVGLSSLYLLTSLLAGSYPALFLSSLRPLVILKGLIDKKRGQDRFRRSLVVLQFTISLSLIIGSIVILDQLGYMLDKDLGFEKDQRIVIPFRTTEARQQLALFKDQVRSVPNVVGSAGSRVYPGQFMAQDFNLYTAGKDMNQSHNVHLIQGDEDYFDVLGIPLLYGRSHQTKDTSSQILINQTALRTLGIQERDALGQQLYSEFRGQRSSYEIIGVVQDYHQSSMKEAIAPMIFEYRPTERNLALLIHSAPGDHSKLVQNLEDKWQSIIPETPFEFHFLDEEIAALYDEESKLARVISAFTIITILISCLGLFGLASFMAEQRTKEIGIRKVLGARVSGIVTSLCMDYLKLVLLAFVFAAPIAYYAMDTWLRDFAYRIEIEWYVFVIAGVLAALVTFGTVSMQTLKVALTNPANSLRAE